MIIVFEQNLRLWCPGAQLGLTGCPRDDNNSSSTTVPLGDSPARDQGSAVKGAAQMWAQAEGPHARCHWLAVKED